MLDYINTGDKPALLTSYQNIFLYKAKTISENLCQKYTEASLNQFEEMNILMDPIEINKHFMKDFNQLVEDFCYDVDLFLSPHQMSKYINDIFKKCSDNAFDHISKYVPYYEEYLRQELTSFELDLKSYEESLDQVIPSTLSGNSSQGNQVRKNYFINFYFI